MKSSLEVLSAYTQGFRNLVNAKVRNGKNTTREILRLSKDCDWNFLCTAMDVVGDASAAIRNFLRFGLNGPTRYEDVGEIYLRLYGLLNAAYIQQQAVLKLYTLMNVGQPKKIKTKFDSLDIRSLRHKLASHSTDYQNTVIQTAETYVPIQLGLGGFNCTYVNNETSNQYSVNLETAVEEHCRLLIVVMDAIYEKAVKTLYKGQSKKLTEYGECLKDLRVEREGGLVIRLPQAAAKLVINILADQNVASNSTQKRRKVRSGKRDNKAPAAHALGTRR